MNIKIIAVGKIKEDYLKDAIDEYKKRLTPFCSLSIVEVKPEKITDENLSDKDKKIEAEKILSNINKDAFVVTLEIKGKMLSSESFAQKIKAVTNEGYNEIIFIIGGADGLDSDVSDIADFKLSFSQMTFTHQMIRLVLIEQIYRAFKINAGEKYHR